MKKYIMSVDAGTTTVKCILFDKLGKIASFSNKEISQIYPQPGWVEQKPEEIFEAVLDVAKCAMKNISVSAYQIESIGIANQRETTIVWDKRDGKPIYNAIVWQCRRTADFCDELKKSNLKKMIHKKTGLIIDAYFSATKIRWILDNVSGANKAARDGHLLFGTVESWIIWNLTGGDTHITDYSNAARTMLFNINSLRWDSELLELFDISHAMLPQACENSTIYGHALPKFFGGPIPIAGAAGDQQSSLFGHGCFDKGNIKCTYGTGCFMLTNIGQDILLNKNGLLTTIAWGIDGKTTYALEGSVFAAGAAIQWLKDQLGIIQNANDSETYAQLVDDTHGCYFVPAFSGLGAPHWNQHVKGEITGLSRGVNKYHIVKACLDSIAYQVNDLVSAMSDCSNLTLNTFKVDGGVSANDYLMQTQADVVNCDITRPLCVESTAMGAAYFAGLAVGFWEGLDELKSHWLADRTFSPNISSARRKKMITGWNKAVQHCQNWHP